MPHITFNRMEEPKEAYCEECNEWATWWTRACESDYNVYFLCDTHAKRWEKIANDAQALVSWVN